MGWQWHQLDHMQIICTTLQTDNHANHSIFMGRMLFLMPKQQCQSTEGGCSSLLQKSDQCFALTAINTVSVKNTNKPRFGHLVFYLAWKWNSNPERTWGKKPKCHSVGMLLSLNVDEITLVCDAWTVQCHIRLLLNYPLIFLVPAHPGCPGQNSESRKMVVWVYQGKLGCRWAHHDMYYLHIFVLAAQSYRNRTQFCTICPVVWEWLCVCTFPSGTTVVTVVVDMAWLYGWCITF